MLGSIAIILLLGLWMGSMFQKLKLPPLAGMMITGMIFGPHALNLIDASILDISSDLRQIALVIILTRAGLSLNLSDLKKVGRPAILMCFLPACAEILGTLLLAPKLLPITWLDAAVMGSVLAAVSPAVIVPRMIRLIDEGYGKQHRIPQLILAGASVDDVFVIVVFTVVTSLAQKGSGASLQASQAAQVSALDFLQIPVSILLGILFGILTGQLLIRFFRRFHMRDSVKILILLSISFLFVELQNALEGILPFSGLLAVMSLGIIIKQGYEPLALRLSGKYNKLWVAAEIFLFVLVGAAVDLKYAASAGIAAVLLVLGALLFRMAGVFLCLIKTELTRKEKLFCMIAYTPKATVQAAIGAVPLSMGLSCGQTVLTVAVLSILITAPLGAVCIDALYKKLLEPAKTPLETQSYRE